MHDFKDKQLGKAIPYGVYDIAHRPGVGERRDRSRHRPVRGQLDPVSWWEYLGQPRYPNATRLQITADCGGSNGNRTRLWKVELQKLADETGLEIAVCHFPPGTSKWNRIEHRLFCFITINWRGKPLVSLETIINLIGATKTSTGLEVYARLDNGTYPDKIKVRDAGAESRQPSRRRVPSRMELHDQTETLIIYSPLDDVPGGLECVQLLGLVGRSGARSRPGRVG